MEFIRASRQEGHWPVFVLWVGGQDEKSVQYQTGHVWKTRLVL